MKHYAELGTKNKNGNFIWFNFFPNRPIPPTQKPFPISLRRAEKLNAKKERARCIAIHSNTSIDDTYSFIY